MEAAILDKGAVPELEASIVYDFPDHKGRYDSFDGKFESIKVYGTGIIERLNDIYPGSEWSSRTACCNGSFTSDEEYTIRNLSFADPVDATRLLKTIVALIHKKNQDCSILVWIDMEAYEKPAISGMKPSKILPWDDEHRFSKALEAAGFTDSREVSGGFHVYYNE